MPAEVGRTAAVQHLIDLDGHDELMSAHIRCHSVIAIGSPPTSTLCTNCQHSLSSFCQPSIQALASANNPPHH